MTESTRKPRLIAPFRGIRYPGSDLSPLVCPPYDIISPPEREELYRLHPHNAIRLEFSLPREGEDCYQAAAHDWLKWLQEGILKEEEEGLYICRAEFSFHGEAHSRIGLLAALHLESLQKGRVLPHEGTLAAPKADRLALLNATHANFSPIWTIFDNPSLGELLGRAYSGAPISRADLTDGSRCSLWRVSDAEMTNQICGMIGDGPIFIADGHHRYETALAFSRQEHEESRGAPVNYVLTLLVEASDPGLIILPTHRAIPDLGKEDMERLWAHLRQCCHLEQVPAGTAGPAAALEGLLKQVYVNDHSFGIYTKAEGCWQFTLKEPSAEPAQGASSAPVAALHRHVLDPVLGGEVKFGYYKDAQEARAAVDSGEYSVAFFLRPLRSEELIQAALSRERLPGKSTYFWPKVPAGLVMRSLR
ncbi:MAG: DUF1015 family protein [Armatimonadetes bacterium]|nr:DUF1015 family protein [Armatimonadota bacterium]NIM23310.1 DUF1015 family protein [Armatimonadota bacterium]NIM67174.1 DUF1015 family protein [Armatimonadota bacterium]NIM75701.1 DUF1015 family protein [Armatimonadota bacterium]NIN05363.1 DUF1015 family protein [Armatimonadota bacterium]